VEGEPAHCLVALQAQETQAETSYAAVKGIATRFRRGVIRCGPTAWMSIGWMSDAAHY